jgi:hypothetical protein
LAANTSCASPTADFAFTICSQLVNQQQQLLLQRHRRRHSRYHHSSSIIISKPYVGDGSEFLISKFQLPPNHRLVSYDHMLADKYQIYLIAGVQFQNVCSLVCLFSLIKLLLFCSLAMMMMMMMVM